MTVAVHALNQVVPHGWLDEVARQAPDFEKLCAVIGRPVAACALVAGVQIARLEIDQGHLDASIVHYSVGPGGRLHELTLGQFRERVGSVVLSSRPSYSLPPEDPDVGELQALIGGSYLLLCVACDLIPTELRVDGDSVVLVVEAGGARQELGLEWFWDRIDTWVREQTGAERGQGEVQIDLSLVDQAEAADARGDWVAIIDKLSGWLNPISIMLRTGQANALDSEARAKLSVGLGMLGTAYSKVGDFQLADEVLRLGIQWAANGAPGAAMFMRLAESCIAQGRFGEAIGLLRRALGLGAEAQEALPVLALAFVKQGRPLAALACVLRAESEGVPPAVLEAVRNEATTALGDEWRTFEDFLAAV